MAGGSGAAVVMLEDVLDGTILVEKKLVECQDERDVVSYLDIEQEESLNLYGFLQGVLL